MRETPLRISLSSFNELRLSRAAGRRLDVDSSNMNRVLRIGIADNWMSLDHATLIREDEHWKIIDYASKNGTRVNGQRRRTATLRDGDVLEMGRTFFVFRAAQATLIDAPPWFEGHELDAIAGLGTMTPVLAQHFDELARLARTSTSILIQGPTGSGKELLARAVHALSGRSGRFVAVNCAGLSEADAERELFGHVQGAFTGATGDRDGLVAASAGGTLFLDEIGDLSASIQGRFLRVLQERAVRPVGGTAEVKLDLRVISTTHRDLVRLVEHGRFRHDLLDRLGSCFALPSLCERREDLGLIMEAVLERIAGPGAEDIEISRDAVRALMHYSWPGNVRELQNVLEHAIALAAMTAVEPRHLPLELQDSVSAGTGLPAASSRSGSRARGSWIMPCDEPATPDFVDSSANDSFLYDAFVSYGHEDPDDRAWVEQVMVLQLERLGLRLCLEHRDSRLAYPRIREMERAVVRSRYTVAVFTPGYFDSGFEEFLVLLSQHQSWESGMARFIPILRRSCRIPLGARMTPLLDLRHDSDVAAGLQRLAAELRRSPRAIYESCA